MAHVENTNNDDTEQEEGGFLIAYFPRQESHCLEFLLNSILLWRLLSSCDDKTSKYSGLAADKLIVYQEYEDS